MKLDLTITKVANGYIVKPNAHAQSRFEDSVKPEEIYVMEYSATDDIKRLMNLIGDLLRGEDA